MEMRNGHFGAYRLGKVLHVSSGGTIWECFDGEEEIGGFVWRESLTGSRAGQVYTVCELHALVATLYRQAQVRFEAAVRGGKLHVAVLFHGGRSETDLIALTVRLRERIPELSQPAEGGQAPSTQMQVMPSRVGAQEAAASPDPAFVALPELPPKIGPYELVDEVGRGGMGVVCRARHPGLDRVVALKIIQVGPATPEEFVQRFLREARLVASLHHPNIVVVHDVGADGANLYFAMDYLEGQTLSEWLEQGAPTEDVLQVMETICRALGYAHAQGVVHRDMKPSNVILLPGLNPIITDFGLAKQLNADEGASALTQSGRVFGTPQYMAPEQALGRTHDIGPAADVYAVGVMLYQAATGFLPYAATNVHELLFRIVSEEPVPPGQRGIHGPPALEHVILKAMARSPGHRYAHGGELADDLARLRAGEETQADRETAGRTNDAVSGPSLA